MIWTADQIQQVRDDWALGYSTSQIARRLGVSKNSAVGKTHRLDLPARPSPIRRGGSPKPAAIASVPREATTLPALASLAQPVFVPTIPNEDKIAALLREGMSIEKVVEATSSTLYYVRRIAKRVELPPKQPKKALPKWMPSGLKGGLSSDDRAEATFGDASAETETRPADRWLRFVVAPAKKYVPLTSPPCCWPIGEPRDKAFRFCGDASEPGRSYCDAHCRVAYVTYRQRVAA